MPGYSRPPSATAETVINNPTGNISATSVQAAINELDTEKASVIQINSTDNNVLSVEALSILGL